MNPITILAVLNLIIELAKIVAAAQAANQTQVTPEQVRQACDEAKVECNLFLAMLEDDPDGSAD